jgi:hypothetical protein
MEYFEEIEIAGSDEAGDKISKYLNNMRIKYLKKTPLIT